MTIVRRTLSGLALLALFVLAACGTRVQRIDPAAVTDLSGRWNDTDSRLAARALIEQSLDAPWSARFSERNGGEPPTVIVGSFSNRTMEHIAVEAFMADLERALINAPSVRMVAGGAQRDELRGERADQQEHARAGSRARPAYERGADYLLTGEVHAIEDAEGREKVVYYQIDATLTDLESNVIVWAGQHTLKKLIERPRIRW